MSKQLNIDVNLNTAKASAQLKSLQQMLQEAINSTTSKGTLTREIVQATEAATKLKSILNSSMNSKGNLDLSKFSANLKASGTNLTQYAQQLNNLGTTGQQAFMSMAKQITTAQAPLKQTNTLTQSLFTSLKNTARWQLSSAMLHGVINTFHNAFSYARGLNESLNSIRIVTGLSANEMDRFAESANKSAKALSSSTLDYTDAALIYYQQGIRDQQQIKERTDATIKMANVTGDSAAKVSNQLTAIWNNFDKGGQNLEYYADVITALGAATASSSSEISAGLEKFASIAEETGLSYEYATSSLATIVATTRQSADVVGTALKTIFGRVQSLNLGETLDDGTTLGKYSQALEKVGISIKDQNGQLKDMDIIIDEMGSKWKDLNRDQRVALAQSVAGARQYNQLMALMENYDFFKENVKIARGSKGTLEEQQEIYAESWQAARDRVKASWQGILDDVISDDFFIGLNNGFAGLLSGVNKFIDTIGGIPGTLGLVGAAFMKLFQNPINKGISNLTTSIKTLKKDYVKEQSALQNQVVSAVGAITPRKDSPQSNIMQVNNLKQSVSLSNAYAQKMQAIANMGMTISNADRTRIASLQELVNFYGELEVKAQQMVEQEQAATEAVQARIAAQAEARAISSTTGSQGTKIMAGVRAKEESTNRTSEAVQSYRTALLGQAGLKSIGNGFTLSSDMRSSLGAFANQALNQVSSTMLVPLTYKDFKAKYGFQTIFDGQGSKPVAPDYKKQQKLFEEFQRTRTLPAGYELWTRKNNGQFNSRYLGSYDNILNQSSTIQNPAYARAQSSADFFNSKRFDNAAQHITRAYQAGIYDKPLEELTEKEQKLYNRSQKALNLIDRRANALDLKGAEKYVASGVIAAAGNGKQGEELRQTVMRGVDAQYQRNAAGQIRKMSADELAKRINAMDPEKVNKGFANAAMGVANVAMGVSSLTAGFKALTNESLTFGEKLLQTSMSFGMGISMMTMGMPGLTKALGGLTKGFSALGALITGQKLGTLFTADGLFGGAIQSLKGALPAILAITAVVGTIAAIKAANKAAFEASPEGQLKTAQQHATDMQTALEQTKSAAESLSASFDNYDSVASNLKGCVKGTQEWTEALRQNNNEVVNMLAKYPQLAAMENVIKKDGDGALSFSKEGREALQKQMEQNVRAAEWASTQAAQDVINKKSLVQQRALGKDFKNLTDYQDSIYTLPLPSIRMGQGNQEIERYSERRLGQSNTKFLDDIALDIANTYDKSGTKKAIEAARHSADQQNASDYITGLKQGAEPFIKAAKQQQEFNKAQDELNSQRINDYKIAAKEEARAAQDAREKRQDLIYLRNQSIKEEQQDYIANKKEEAENIKRNKEIRKKIEQEEIEQRKKEYKNSALGRDREKSRKELLDTIDNVFDTFKDTSGAIDNARKDALQTVSNENAKGQSLGKTIESMINSVEDTYTQNYQERRMGNTAKQVNLAEVEALGNTQAPILGGLHDREMLNVNEIPIRKDSLQMMLSGNMMTESYHERADKSINGLFNKFQDPKEAGLNIIAEHWDQLMGLTVDEMGPVLDKVFQGTGVSMIDSSAWAKELTTNSDLRAALNENAASMMAAQTAQAAQEASTINEELIADGYSKGESERISKMLGQQGKLSELTKTETDRIDRELRKKDTNAQDLAKQYIASMGGMESSLTWSKTGISYKDASGADQTATWDMMSSALGAAAALEQLGTSAQSAAQFLATLHSDDISDDTSKGVEEYLENGDFLNMKPEELAEQAGKSAKDISKELKKAFDEDTFKEATGKSIDEFAEAMENTAKGNLEAWNQMFGGMTEAQKEQMQGLNKYQEMSAGELISYYNRHFKDQELIKLPDLSEDVKTYAQLEEEVGTIDEAWGKVGNSIKNGTHLTQDMYDLFEALDVNAGDWGQFVDGDLITDAEGLIECLNEATNSTRDLIEHARQMDMITYDNLTEDLLNLVANTDNATRATDAFGDSLENILSQMDGLELSMAKYQQLQETLNGSTALFDQFDKAKTADAAADWSDEWSSAIQDINELISKGDYGGQAWQTGQQLLLPERLQGASAKETQDYISSLSNRGFITNEGKGQYDVTWDNAVNFANAALNTKLDNGNTVFSGSLSEGFKLDSSIKSLNDLAAAMDLSETSASALFSRLALVAHDGDSLWTQLAENAGDFGTQILTAEEEVATLGEKLNAARKAGNWEEYEQIKQQIQEAGAEVDKLKQKANQKVEFQLDLKDKLQEAETQVEKTTTEYERLKALAEQNPNNYGLQQALEKARQEMEAAKKKWKELTGQIEDVSEFEIKINLEQAYSKLQKLKETIQEVQNDTVINGKHQRNESVASKNIVDQYGHKIVTKKGLQDYSQAVEQKINVTVEATGADEVYADIKSRYEATKGEVEGNPAKIKANNTLALIKIAAAKAAATAFASGTYNASLTATDNTGGAIASATAKVLAFKALADSAGLFQGSAQFSGSAYERGSWGIKSNKKNALVGELGQELIVDPQTGRYYTVGDAGAEFVDIPKGAIIFNHRQTEGLLKNRRINTRGQAYLQGSAFAGLPTIEAPPGKTLPTSPSPSPKPSPSPSPAPSPRQTPQTQKPKGAAADANGEILTYEEQLLNIIRDEVDEYANLERSITRLEHAYKNFTRNNDRLWGKALLENIQKSIDQGKKLYEAEYAKLEKRKDDYAKSTARLNSTNELQYQQKVLVGGTYAKDPKYNTQLITFQDFKGMDFLTGLGLLDESALQRGANGEVTGVNDVVAVDRAIEEYLRQKGIEANTLRTSKPGEEGEVAAENLMNNANAIAELLNKLLKEYTDSEADMLEQEEKAQDILEEIHDLAAQAITQEMNMRIQLQENEKKFIDFQFKRLEKGGLFKQVEKYLKIFNPFETNLRENRRFEPIIKSMDAAAEAYQKATDQLALGRADYQNKDAISQNNFIDITQKSLDEVMKGLDELLDLVNTIGDAFGETADLAKQEIEKYTSRMEFTVSILDHMNNLLDLTGRKMDFEAKDTIIRGSMHNLKNAWEEAEHWADLMTQQREASEQTYQELLTTDAAGAEWYKANVLEKSYEMEQDALDKMYSAAENYLQRVEDLWANSIEKITSDWAEAATNGLGYDYLTSSMSRAKSIQEEYLTTTNKLYETNTLMRKVSKDIDKTDSKISKEKLANFNKEIEAAQQKNKLSVAEMDILKARYEILEAELALEEAKNAKSIVRLQRDSEGNYGYVYTADQGDIDDKEQDLADKRNDLYNLVLGIENDNQEKRMQIYQEYSDAAKQLWDDYHNKHLMDETEYQDKLTALKQQASEKLEAIDGNLSQAEYWLGKVAAEGVSEAWANSYADQMASSTEFMDYFDEASNEAESIIEEIDGIRDEATENAKLGLDDVTEKTKDLTIKNDELAAQLHDTAERAAEEMSAMDHLTESLAAQYTEVQGLIDKYLELAQAMQAAMVAEGPSEAGQYIPDYSLEQAHEFFKSGGEFTDAYEELEEGRHNKSLGQSRSFWAQSNDEERKELEVSYKYQDQIKEAGYDPETFFSKITAGITKNGDWSQFNSYTDEELLKFGGVQLASGGYTGEWGSEGKLAILHEKELVLNKDDTSNFLKALEVAKEGYMQAIQMQQLQEMYQQQMLASTEWLRSTNFQNNTETLQQEVTIHAEFPNVSSHSEIEEAFSNLVNRASQYANRDGWAKSYNNRLLSSM